MATGWAGDGAVQQQIDDSIADAIKRARAQLPAGPGLSHCEECGEAIPEARRQAVPGQAVRPVPGRGRPPGAGVEPIQPAWQQGQPVALRPGRFAKPRFVGAAIGLD